jgi:hypothetical protein
MLAKVMPHLKVGAQKWTAEHGRSVGGHVCLQITDCRCLPPYLSLAPRDDSKRPATGYLE